MACRSRRTSHSSLRYLPSPEPEQVASPAEGLAGDLERDPWWNGESGGKFERYELCRRRLGEGVTEKANSVASRGKEDG